MKRKWIAVMTAAAILATVPAAAYAEGTAVQQAAEEKKRKPSELIEQEVLISFLTEVLAEEVNSGVITQEKMDELSKQAQENGIFLPLRIGNEKREFPEGEKMEKKGLTEEEKAERKEPPEQKEGEKSEMGQKPEGVRPDGESQQGVILSETQQDALTKKAVAYLIEQGTITQEEGTEALQGWANRQAERQSVSE